MNTLFWQRQWLEKKCDFYYLFADVAHLEIKYILKKKVQICKMFPFVKRDLIFNSMPPPFHVWLATHGTPAEPSNNAVKLLPIHFTPLPPAQWPCVNTTYPDGLKSSPEPSQVTVAATKRDCVGRDETVLCLELQLNYYLSNKRYLNEYYKNPSIDLGYHISDYIKIPF